MRKSLLILGAGQYGYVVKEIAEAMECFEKIDFLDDNNDVAIGKLSDCEKLADKYSYAFVAIGNSNIRLNWINKLEEKGYDISVLIHPKAYVSPSAQLNKGTCVDPFAVINSNSTLGRGCIVSAGAVINHNCFIGDACHIDCNATVKAGSAITPHTKAECGSVIVT